MAIIAMLSRYSKTPDAGCLRDFRRLLSIRLDTDVLAWLKSKGDGYQTKVNIFLQEQMLKEIRK